MVKVLLGTIWALFAVMLLGVCAIYGLFWYESFSGELDGDNNAPIYVATDEAAFAILQRLPLDNPEQLRQAERRTNGRVLAVGSRTRVRIKSELYFDGMQFHSGLFLSSAHKRQMRRVFSVQILDRSSKGLTVLVPAERFHNYAFL